MEIILTKDVQGLGEEGDIKKVADGYGRNYLIPYGFAVRKDTINLRKLEKRRSEIEDRKAKKIEEAKDILERLNSLTLTFKEKAADNQKMFGSVTAADIYHELEKLNIELDRRQIELGKPIKILGTYPVNIKLREGIVATINVEVINIDESKQQAEQAVEEGVPSKSSRKPRSSKKTEEATLEETTQAKEDTTTESSETTEKETAEKVEEETKTENE